MNCRPGERLMTGTGTWKTPRRGLRGAFFIKLQRRKVTPDF